MVGVHTFIAHSGDDCKTLTNVMEKKETLPVGQFLFSARYFRSNFHIIHMTRICIHNISLHYVFELGARDIKRYCMKPFVPYSWDIKQW